MLCLHDLQRRTNLVVQCVGEIFALLVFRPHQVLSDTSADVEHSGSSSFFQPTKNLSGLHTDQLVHCTLQYKEMRVVDVEANAVKERLHFGLIADAAIQMELLLAGGGDLARDGDDGELAARKLRWCCLRVVVQEVDLHCGLLHTRVTTLVDEVLGLLCTDLFQIADTEDETNGIEDVALATAVQAGDGVEMGVDII